MNTSAQLNNAITAIMNLTFIKHNRTQCMMQMRERLRNIMEPNEYKQLKPFFTKLAQLAREEEIEFATVAAAEETVQETVNKKLLDVELAVLITKNMRELAPAYKGDVTMKYNLRKRKSTVTGNFKVDI